MDVILKNVLFWGTELFYLYVESIGFLFFISRKKLWYEMTLQQWL